MSNLYKSGFVSFSQQNTLVIDANKNRVIRQIDEENQKRQQESVAGEETAATEDGFQSFEVENIDMAEVREQAGAIFEDAQASAEKILEDARAQALMLKEEARQSGIEEGYQKGMEDAAKQLEAQEAELQAHYETIRQQLEEDYQQELREAEPKLVNVVCRLLHKMTGILAEDYQDVMVHIIDQALQELDSSEKITIKVSEDDYADVYSQMDRLKQQVNSNIELELIADTKLSKLQCLIETETGIINCSLGEQLDRLCTSLKLLSQM